jgi:hypothetical protein
MSRSKQRTHSRIHSPDAELDAKYAAIYEHDPKAYRVLEALIEYGNGTVNDMYVRVFERAVTELEDAGKLPG